MTPSEVEALRKILKPLSTAKDLVGLGLVGSVRTANNQRVKGEGVPFIKLPSGGIRYTPNAIISHIQAATPGKMKGETN